ncbi:MAG: SAM-dependent methyltransferase, partial [Mycobacterium sp.]|nr:SAM-dependent methyltransferase [Mycobacterium sp.]
VLAHSRELLRHSGETNVIYIDGDISDPATIIDNPQARDILDFDQPVGYIHAAIWHFVPDDADPWALTRQYMDAVPTGSYLALSHVTADGQDEAKVQRFKDVYQKSTSPLHFRTREEIARFFNGLGFLPPYEGAE